jgi:hypothetical protein
MKINVDYESCHKCKRSLDDIGVWIEREERAHPKISEEEIRDASSDQMRDWLAGLAKKTWVRVRPLCRSCYTFADTLDKAVLVCAGCGFKAHVPEWFAHRLVRWTARYGYDYSEWTCSPRCYARKQRKGNRWKGRTCEVCGEAFTSARADASTCSSACRQKRYRRSRAGASA